MRGHIAGACLAVLALTSCSADEVEPEDAAAEDVERETPEPDEEPDETEDPLEDEPEPAGLEDLAEEYLRLTMSRTVSKIEEAADLAAPGSIADAYRSFQLASAQANATAGFSVDPDTVQSTDNGLEACSQDGGCSTYSDFDGSELLESFTIDGEHVGDRLAQLEGEHDLPGGGTLRPTTAYEPMSFDGLMVTFTVQAGEHALDVAFNSATYITESGTQLGATDGQGSWELRAGSTGHYFVLVADAGLGGELIVDGFVDPPGESMDAWEVGFPAS